MEFTVEIQLLGEDEQILQKTSSSNVVERMESRVTNLTFVVCWYHHALWTSYFATDFGLRLLTMGLFLGQRRLRPYNLWIVGGIIIIYVAACFLTTKSHDRLHK